MSVPRTRTLPALLPAGLLCAGLLLTGCAEIQALEEAARIEDETQQVEEARDLFERFVVLGNRYDLGLADLYAEDAQILLIERKHGELRKVAVAGSDFKAVVTRTLPRARKQGEHSSYSDVTFEVHGERVRIDAVRTALPEGYKVPHILVVGPSDRGNEWLIYQEVSVTPL